MSLDTATLDQLLAAATEATGRVANAPGARRVTPALAKFAVTAAWERRGLRRCPHLRAVLVAPEYAVLGAAKGAACWNCLPEAMLSIPRHADHDCDRCGNTARTIWSTMVVVASLTVVFGLCAGCCDELGSVR